MNVDHIPRFFVKSVLGPQCHTIPQMKDENLYFNQKIFKNSQHAPFYGLRRVKNPGICENENEKNALL